jgi:hypothetical protein
MRYADLLARDTAAAEAQAAINGLTRVGEIRDAILAEIQKELGQYPQYAGYGEDMALGFITKQVKTKRGIAFKRGDVVLYKKDGDPENLGLDEFVAYSVRNGIGTLIDPDAIEPLATSTTYRHPDGLVTLAES